MGASHMGIEFVTSMERIGLSPQFLQGYGRRALAGRRSGTSMTVNVGAAAKSIGNAMKNAAATVDTGIHYVGDQIVQAAHSVPVVETSRVASSMLNSAVSSLSGGMSSAAKSGCDLVHTGMSEGATEISQAMRDAAASTADGIFNGFNEVSQSITASYEMLSESIYNSTVKVTNTVDILTVENTDEILLTIVSASMILIPLFVYLYILLKVEKKNMRSVFVQLVGFAMVVCGIGAMMQYFRYVFSGTFSIVNIVVSFFLAFYAFVCFLYFVYVFFYEIKTVWKYTKASVIWLWKATKATIRWSWRATKTFWRWVFNAIKFLWGIAKNIASCMFCGCRCLRSNRPQKENYQVVGTRDLDVGNINTDGRDMVFEDSEENEEFVYITPKESPLYVK